MKTLLIALNSKYIHSSLSAWYLKANCSSECGEVDVMEFTINDILDDILSQIYREKPDIIAFSCYIWNISQVLLLAENLKKVLPIVKIIAGGPEVSYDSKEILMKNPQIDYIISGEGENSFNELLMKLGGSKVLLENIKGVSYRTETGIHQGSYAVVEDMNTIISPYTDEMLKRMENKIIYFESSRGCPFACSYCISSTFEGVRYFSAMRVKKELSRLIDYGVRQVKFVDRTFNCNKARFKEIVEFILDYSDNVSGQALTGFHFEAAADLFDDEMVDLLKRAPSGLIQLEIGVQSTNAEALSLVKRKTDLYKVFHYVKKLKEPGNIHLHLDLIAGLPGEDINSFKNSFNEVYSLRPDQLQLGFLKMLKGSKIREEAEYYQYKVRSQPPYEILCNKYISFDNILKLKDIEKILDRFYNSGKFIRTLRYVVERYFDNPFDFFDHFRCYNIKDGRMEKKLSLRQLYEIFIDFAHTFAESNKMNIITELLKFDFLSSDNSNNLPEGLNRNICEDFKEKCFEFLKNKSNIIRYIKHYEGIPSKQIIKKVHFEIFNFDVTASEETFLSQKTTVVLFDYNIKDPVTGLYRHIILEDFFKSHDIEA